MTANDAPSCSTDNNSSPTSPHSPHYAGPSSYPSFAPPNTVAPQPHSSSPHRPDAVLGGGTHRWGDRYIYIYIYIYISTSTINVSTQVPGTLRPARLGHRRARQGRLRAGAGRVGTQRGKYYVTLQKIFQDSRESYAARHYAGSSNTVAPPPPHPLYHGGHGGGGGAGGGATLSGHAAYRPGTDPDLTHPVLSTSSWTVADIEGHSVQETTAALSHNSSSTLPFHQLANYGSSIFLLYQFKIFRKGAHEYLLLVKSNNY